MSSISEPLEPRTLFSGASAIHVGALDSRFFVKGQTSLALSAQQFAAAGIVAQPDHKVLVAGTTTAGQSGTSDFLVARLNADGSPDTSFGTNGIVTIDFQNTNDTAGQVIEQSDGKIIVVGATQSLDQTTIANRPDTDLAIVRLNSDGSLDSTFNSTGKLILDLSHLRAIAYGAPVQELPTADMANCVAELGNGQFIVAGTVFADDFLAGDMFALRLNSDGSTDTSFGFNSTGLSTAPFNGDTVANSLLIQRDGKIVLGGADTGGLITQMALIRLNANGQYDQSFAQSGHATFSFSEVFDTVTALAQQKDGKLLIGGAVVRGQLGASGAKGADGELALLRLNKNGVPDKTFGPAALDGLTLTPIPGDKIAAVSSIAVQSDGNILVGAKATTPAGLLSSSRQIVLARFTAKGQLDKTFGAGGISKLPPAATFPDLHRNGTQIVGAMNNTIGPQSSEEKLRAFLYDAAGQITQAPGDDVFALTSTTTGSNSAIVVNAVATKNTFTDLSEKFPTLPSKISPVQPILVTVTNSGNTTATGPASITLFASANRVKDAGDTPIGSISTSLSLKPGASRTIKVFFSHGGPSPVGSDYLIGVLDFSGTPLDIHPLNGIFLSAQKVAF